MAFMNFNPAYPVHYIDYRVRSYSIERDPVILFIEEVIDYSLRRHNLHNWTPPVNLVVARTLNALKYFNGYFAERVVDPSTEEEAVRLARGLGFHERTWLHFNDMQQARCYMQGFLSQIYNHNSLFLFRMFSFACYSSRIALRRYQNILVNAVLWALYPISKGLVSHKESLRQICYVNNLHDNRHLNDQPGYVDEGIVASRLSRNERSVFYVDPILLFVEEFIDYFLHYHNIKGRIPGIDLEYLRSTEKGYYTDNFGVAISHFSEINLDGLTIARDWGFNDESWLKISTDSEAINYQHYFLRQVCLRGGKLEMLSFACYSSKLALQNRRNALVNHVVWALVGILRQIYPDGHQIMELNYWAREYYMEHQYSSDDGFCSAGTENVGFEENNEAEPAEETSSVKEQNEAEGTNSQSSTEGNEAKVTSILNASEGKTEDQKLEEAIQSDTLEEKPPFYEKENETEEDDSQFSKVGNAIKEESESESSEMKSGYESSEEASESDASKGKSGRKSAKKVRVKPTLEGKSESDALEENADSSEKQNETEEGNSLYSTVENVANITSGSDDSEGKSGYESSEEASESDAPEGKSGWKAWKKAKEMETLEDESGWETLEEKAHSDEKQNETEENNPEYSKFGNKTNVPNGLERNGGFEYSEEASESEVSERKSGWKTYESSEEASESDDSEGKSGTESLEDR